MRITRTRNKKQVTKGKCTNGHGDRAKIINVCLLNRACLRNCFCSRLSNTKDCLNEIQGRIQALFQYLF